MLYQNTIDRSSPDAKVKRIHPVWGNLSTGLFKLNQLSSIVGGVTGTRLVLHRDQLDAQSIVLR